MRCLLVSQLLLVCLHIHSQQQLSGKVLDQAINQPLSLVTIQYQGLKGQTHTSISDLDGRFYLRNIDLNQSIHFSHIGYESICYQAELKNVGKTMQLMMQPKPFLLGEVVVEGENKLSAEAIISKVKINLEQNMFMGQHQIENYQKGKKGSEGSGLIVNLHQFEGFQREYRMKEGKYVFFAEATFKQINGGYEPVAHVANMTYPIEYRISDQDYSISSINPSNMHFPRFKNDDMCNYNEILLPLVQNQCFVFECGDTMKLEGKELLVVYYKINKKVSSRNLRCHCSENQFGELHIDPTDWSVHCVLNKDSNHWPGGERKEDSTIKAMFSKIEGKYYLTSVDYDSTGQEENLISGKMENVVKVNSVWYDKFNTSIDADNLFHNYSCKVSNDDRFGKQTPFFFFYVTEDLKQSKYNSEFWTERESFADWEQVRIDLETMTGRTLEEQFADNSEFLIPEKKFLEIRNKLKSKDIRRHYKRVYADFKKLNRFKD